METKLPKFTTVKQVKIELIKRGGYLEKVWDTELPEYVPHFSLDERGWKNGAYIRSELLDWANETLR